MKKEIIISLAIVVFLIGGLAIYKRQESMHQLRAASCKEVSTEQAKTKAQEIDSGLLSYSSTTKDIMDRSTEGGEQTNYTSHRDRVLIKQIFFGETGKSEAFYYLFNNKIFYVKKINTEYLLPLSEDTSGKVKNISIREFVLNNHQEICFWYKDGVFQEIDQDVKDLLNYLVSGV